VALRTVAIIDLNIIQIECAFLIYTSGTQISNGQFSRDIVGTVVADHVYTAQMLSERRMKKILALCGAQKTELQAISLKERLASFNRHALYEPSSPINASDSN